MKALRSRICENFERVSVSEFIIQGLSNERLVSNWIVEMILNKSYFDASVNLCWVRFKILLFIQPMIDRGVILSAYLLFLCKYF